MKLEEVNQRTKEAVDFLVAALQSGHSAVLTQYLAAMAKFRNYSFGNIMLIARQKPDASHVAGFRTWNSLGRFVRRGEKGIFILAPMVGNRRKNSAREEQTEDAKENQPRLYGFRAVYVFDITQTEGQDLPTLTEVHGDVSGYVHQRSVQSGCAEQCDVTRRRHPRDDTDAGPWRQPCNARWRIVGTADQSSRGRQANHSASTRTL
jgi:hypothetical protein